MLIFFRVTIDHIYKSNLLLLYIPKGTESKVLNCCYKIQSMLIKNQLKLKLIMTSQHIWRIELTNGIKINLGHYNIINRLSLFFRIITVLLIHEKSHDEHINYIDLRYNSRTVVS